MTQIKMTAGFVLARAGRRLEQLSKITMIDPHLVNQRLRCQQLLAATENLLFSTEMLVSVEDMLILQKG